MPNGLYKISFLTDKYIKMNAKNLKGLIASELIIVAREEKGKRPTELNFEELIDVTDSIVKKLFLYGVVGRSEQLFCPSCDSKVIISDERHNVKMCGVCKHQWAK